MTLRMRKKLDSLSSLEEEVPASSLTASSDAYYLWPFTIFHPSNITASSDLYWNSGSFAPASIRLDLGSAPIYVTRIALEAVMLPAMGRVRHEVRTGLTLDGLHSACWYTGVAVDGEWMHFQLTEEGGGLRRRVRYLEIKTHESPSWVAWRGIRVWKAVT